MSFLTRDDILGVFNISGQTVVVNISGLSVTASISGQTVTTSISTSGQGVWVSGTVATSVSGNSVNISTSGQGVWISGTVTTSVSGNVVTTSISGNAVTTSVSGNVVNVSGNMVNISGQVSYKLPFSTNIDIGSNTITNASGGTVLQSGTTILATNSMFVQNPATNSGTMRVGGNNAGDYPTTSKGFILTPGASIELHVQQLDYIAVWASVSGENVNWLVQN